jgi:hypothetical protein
LDPFSHIGRAIASLFGCHAQQFFGVFNDELQVFHEFVFVACCHLGCSSLNDE